MNQGPNVKYQYILGIFLCSALIATLNNPIIIIIDVVFIV